MSKFFFHFYLRQIEILMIHCTCFYVQRGLSKIKICGVQKLWERLKYSATQETCLVWKGAGTIINEFIFMLSQASQVGGGLDSGPRTVFGMSEPPLNTFRKSLNAPPAVVNYFLLPSLLVNGVKYFVFLCWDMSPSIHPSPIPRQTSSPHTTARLLVGTAHSNILIYTIDHQSISQEYVTCLSVCWYDSVFCVCA